ncbi:MAG TPA: preprotein translocase subunit SecE [Bacteroidales bacterium]
MKNFFSKIGISVKESYSELVYKVSWPTIPELTNSAVVVMFTSLIIAMIVFFMDLCFENVMLLFYKSIL